MIRKRDKEGKCRVLLSHWLWRLGWKALYVRGRSVDIQYSNFHNLIKTLRLDLSTCLSCNPTLCPPHIYFNFFVINGTWILGRWNKFYQFGVNDFFGIFVIWGIYSLRFIIKLNEAVWKNIIFFSWHFLCISVIYHFSNSGASKFVSNIFLIFL